MSKCFRRRFVKALVWLIPATLLALAPKCFLCLAAYAGIGAALGLAGQEICGAAPLSAMNLWTMVFALIGPTLAVLGFIRFYARRRRLNTNAAARFSEKQSGSQY